MNRLKYFFYWLICIVLLLPSCSVEKRRYTNGYHLEWKKYSTLAQNNKTTSIKDSTKLKAKDNIVSAETFNVLTASAEKKKGIVLLSPDSTRCDTLIMRDGTEVKVKVMEVTPTEIKYKFCNYIDGPMHVVYRYNASYVKYANGTLDSFVSEHPPQQNSTGNNSNPNNGTYNKNNGYYGQNSGGYNQNNRAYNGNNGGSSYGQNDARSSINSYAENEYVRKISLASLICGICSIFIPYLGAIAAIVAILLGSKSMRLIRRDPQNLWIYSRRSMAGLVIGWIVLCIYIIVVFALLIALGI